MFKVCAQSFIDNDSFGYPIDLKLVYGYCNISALLYGKYRNDCSYVKCDFVADAERKLYFDTGHQFVLGDILHWAYIGHGCLVIIRISYSHWIMTGVSRHKSFDPGRAESVCLGNRNIYFNFVSFRSTDMALFFEIIPHGWQGPAYPE